MARVYTFLIILTGMMLLLNLSGIQTGSSLILTATGIMGETQNYNDAPMYQKIIAIIEVVAVATIIVGLIFQNQSDTILAAGFSVMLLGFVGDAYSILTFLNESLGSNNWVSWIVLLILGPLIVGYLVSIISYWRGAD